VGIDTTRRLAVLPLAFFAVTTAVNIVDGTPAILLWLCNACNVLLAIGLAAPWPRAVWIATMWLVVSMPIWAVDAALYSGFEVHSFLTHVAAPLVGLYALRFVPKPPGLWWQALTFLAALQLVSRLVTPPAANVNAAFATYQPLARLVPSYPVYWLGTTCAFALALALSERVLARLASSRMLG
jgi:hypothetical protein